MIVSCTTPLLTITRRLQYFKIGRAREGAEVFMFNMALISRFVEPFLLSFQIFKFAFAA